MAKELRINVVVRLPEGPFEEAEALLACKPALDALRASLAGEFSVEYEVVIPKPRGGRSAFLEDAE